LVADVGTPVLAVVLGCQ
jgi:hypothetical protein